MPNSNAERDNDGLVGSMAAWSVLVETLVQDGVLDRDDLARRLKSELHRREEIPNAAGIKTLRKYLIQLLSQPGAASTKLEIANALHREPYTTPAHPPAAKSFDLSFGARLGDILRKDTQNPTYAGMIHGFLLALDEDRKSEHLTYGYYALASAREDGHFELFEVDGILFVVPQTHARELLAGTHLEMNEKRRLVIESRDS